MCVCKKRQKGNVKNRVAVRSITVGKREKEMKNLVKEHKFLLDRDGKRQRELR